MSEVVENSLAGKRALLRQMGVDVWLSRSGERAPTAELSAAEDAKRAAVPAEALNVPPAGLKSVLGAESGQRTDTSAASASGKVAAPVSATAGSAGPAVAPFSVACLSKGPVMMLVELTRSKATRRFALDVLAASSGQYGGDTAQLAFDWPQPGVDNHAETVRKALGAFIAKQIGDQAPALVLVDREVAGRLEQVPDGCILMAPVAELMVDGEKKRALWAEIEGRR